MYGYAAGGFLAIIVAFFVIRWILLRILMPGNVVQEIPSADEAVARVSASHLTIMGLISFFLLKICGKK